MVKITYPKNNIANEKSLHYINKNGLKFVYAVSPNGVVIISYNKK